MKTIIVVEDEPDTAEMFAEMMRLSGHNVVKTLGGSSAIDLISEKRPDAVVLDLMMPDLSGFEVLGFMRRHKTLAEIPVIVVSARSLPSDVQVGLKAGAFQYLTKPVAYMDLKAAVDRAVSRTS